MNDPSHILAPQVWRNPTIKRLICRYAPKQTLLSLMRADKEAFAEGVKALFFEMDWTVLQRFEKKASKSYQTAVTVLRFATYDAIKKATISEIYQRFPHLQHPTVIKNNLVWVLTFPHPDGHLQERPLTAKKSDAAYKFGSSDVLLHGKDGKTVAALRPEWEIIDTRVNFFQGMGGAMSWTGSRLASDTAYDIHADDHRLGPIDSYKELLLRNDGSAALVVGLRRNDDFRYALMALDVGRNKLPSRIGLLLIRWAGLEPAAIIRFLKDISTTDAMFGRVDKIHLDLEFPVYHLAFPNLFFGPAAVHRSGVPNAKTQAIRMVQIDLMIVELVLEKLLDTPRWAQAFEAWLRRLVDDLFAVSGGHTIIEVDIKTKVSQPARGARKVKKDEASKKLEQICRGVIRTAGEVYVDKMEKSHVLGWERIANEGSEA